MIKATSSLLPAKCQNRLPTKHTKQTEFHAQNCMSTFCGYAWRPFGFHFKFQYRFSFQLAFVILSFTFAAFVERESLGFQTKQLDKWQVMFQRWRVKPNPNSPCEPDMITNFIHGRELQKDNWEHSRLVPPAMCQPISPGFHHQSQTSN